MLTPRQRQEGENEGLAEKSSTMMTKLKCRTKIFFFPFFFSGK